VQKEWKEEVGGTTAAFVLDCEYNNNNAAAAADTHTNTATHSHS